MVLDLDEEVVLPEDLLKPACALECALVVAPQERLQHVPAEAAGGADEPFAVARQQLPIEAGLVVIALEIRKARQLDEIAVSGVVFGEQGEVVVELASRFGVSTRIVDSPTTSRALVPRLVGHVGLGSDDWLDTLRLALAVEVENAVHVSVVGDTERRLAVCGRGRHEFVET